MEHFLRLYSYHDFKKLNPCKRPKKFWSQFEYQANSIMDILDRSDITVEDRLWCLTRQGVLPEHVMIDITVAWIGDLDETLNNGTSFNIQKNINDYQNSVISFKKLSEIAYDIYKEYAKFREGNFRSKECEYAYYSLYNALLNIVQVHRQEIAFGYSAEQKHCAGIVVNYAIAATKFTPEHFLEVAIDLIKKKYLHGKA